MRREGVRAPVWIALAASGAFLALVLASHLSGTGGAGVVASPAMDASARPARRPVAPAMRPSTPADRRYGESRASATVAPPGAGPPAPSPETTPSYGLSLPRDERSAELVGLEREAADLAESNALLDPDDVEARLAQLERLPGETSDDFARRLEVARERILTDELLLQQRLGELFETTVYPPGFPVERAVVTVERQLIGQLPPEDRAASLRLALEDDVIGRAEPRFEAAAPADAREAASEAPAL